MFKPKPKEVPMDPAAHAARARLASDEVRLERSARKIAHGADEMRKQVKKENHISASVMALLQYGRGHRP